MSSRPTRVAATWLYDAWPDAAAVESFDLHETDGVTTLSCRLEFRDQASLRLFAGAVRTLATEAKHLDPKPIHWRPRTDRPTPALPTTAK